MKFPVPPIALAVLLLATPPAIAAPRTHVVVIDKMRFGAMPTGVRAGDRISWINKDMFRHTATANDGSFNADQLIADIDAVLALESPLDRQREGLDVA